MKTRLLSIILCIYFATSCSPNVTSVPNPTATVINTPTVIPTNTPDPLVAQKATMLYQQDFESGIPSGIYFWTKWNVQIEDSGNHVFCNAPSAGWIGSLFGHSTWSDYAVEMKVKFLDLKQDQSVAINSRMNSIFSEKYSGSLGYGGASLYYNEPFISLGNHEVTTANNRWYTLRIEAVGNLIKYYIDQFLVVQNTDDHRQQGFGGIGVSPQTKICVDDIRVWALTNAGSIAQAPTQLPASANNDKPLVERLDTHKFPKLFLQNQDLMPSDEFLNQAIYWDLIVLDVDAITTKPDYLGPSGIIRQNNANAVILTYVSAADIDPGDPNYIRGTLNSQIKPEWYMRDIQGKIYHLFPVETGRWTPMFNISTDINTFMPDFLAKNVMNTGLVDGIFFDWINESFSWLKYRTDNPPNSQIDINGDGKLDIPAMIDTMWSQGTSKMLSESRRLFPAGSLIMGNSGFGSLAVSGNAKTDNTYLNLLNGRQLEGFLSHKEVGWLQSMRAAALMDQASSEPKIPLFLAHGTENDFDHLRYTLASALMFDGYFNMAEMHEGTDASPYTATWWYDEYAVDLKTGQAVQSLDAKGYLGLPLTKAYNTENNKELLEPLLINNDSGVEYSAWRRDFQNGIVLVNPSGTGKTIELHGTYRKILGVKDPKFNDGSTVTKITLPAHGGIILLNMP